MRTLQTWSCIILVVMGTSAWAIYFDADPRHPELSQWCVPNSEYLLILEHSCIKHLQRSEFRRAREVRAVALWQAAHRKEICGQDEHFHEEAVTALANAEAARAQLGAAWRCDPPVIGSIWSDVMFGQGGEPPQGRGRDPRWCPPESSTWRNTTRWPTDVNRTNSGYGPRQIVGRPDFHSALDLAVSRAGTAVQATEGGVVLFEDHGHPPTYPRDGRLNYIKIRGNSGIVLIYGHVHAAEGIVLGTQVTAGQVIGYVDISGRSSGPHVHFATALEDNTNQRFNPQCYLEVTP